jgi:uncharacterized membrane protein YvbJ
MKACSSCGNPIADERIWCPHCGARFAELGYAQTKETNRVGREVSK